MIVRGLLFVLVFGGFFALAMWGIDKKERTVAMKWGVRLVLSVLFGIMLVVGFSLMEGVKL